MGGDKTRKLAYGKKDLERSRRVVEDLHNGSLALDDEDRQQVIKEIQSKLKEYCKTYRILPKAE
jgi:hypothetical protein